MKESGFKKDISGMHRFFWMVSLCRLIVRSLLSWCLLALPVAVKAEFSYTTNNNEITITSYFGSEYELVIPDSINGYPVTAIGSNAFTYETDLYYIFIPEV